MHSALKKDSESIIRSEESKKTYRFPLLEIPPFTGCPHIHLEYELKIKTYLYRACFVFCSSHFEFFSAKSGTEIMEVWDGRENSQILGSSRSLPKDNKVTRDETSD